MRTNFKLFTLLITAMCWHGMTGCQTDSSSDNGPSDTSDMGDGTDTLNTNDTASNTDTGDDTGNDATDETDDFSDIDEDTLEWQLAALTWYESYPDEGSAECIEYNGCEWAGWFAGLPDKMSPEWVASHNIAAVHEDHFGEYSGKTLRVRKGDHKIDVVVYDMCSDADCDGCCTDNMWSVGFLIDMEIHTIERFGVDGGAVEFACLDCSD